MNCRLLCRRQSLFRKRSIFSSSSAEQGVLMGRGCGVGRKKDAFYRWGGCSVRTRAWRKRELAALTSLILLTMPLNADSSFPPDPPKAFSSFSPLLAPSPLRTAVLPKLKSEGAGVAVRLVLLVVPVRFFLSDIPSSRFQDSTETVLRALNIFMRTDWYFFLKKPTSISMASHSMSQCLTLASPSPSDSQRNSRCRQSDERRRARLAIRSGRCCFYWRRSIIVLYYKHSKYYHQNRRRSLSSSLLTSFHFPFLLFESTRNVPPRVGGGLGD